MALFYHQCESVDVDRSEGIVIVFSCNRLLHCLAINSSVIECSAIVEVSFPHQSHHYYSHHPLRLLLLQDHDSTIPATVVAPRSWNHVPPLRNMGVCHVCVCVCVS